MRQFIYCCILIICFTNISFSQVLNSYGIKVGYVHSRQDYSVKDIDDFIEWKSGFSISIYADLFNYNNFSVSPEVKYIEKGWVGKFIITGPESPAPIGIKYEYVHHNYLSLLFSIQYKIDYKFGKALLKLAPRYDKRLKSYDDFDNNPSTYKDYKDVFGGTFSLGFIPKLKTVINPFIEISYHLDFSNSFSIPTNKIKNRALEFNLGIEF